MKSKYIKINFRLYERVTLELTKHILINSIPRTTYSFYRLSSQEKYVFFKKEKKQNYNLKNLKNPFLLSLFLAA
jgi:hypothetical protein